MKIELSDVHPENPLPGASWIDSHVHFDGFEREGVLADLFKRASAAGVEGMIAIGGSDEANERAVRIAAERPGIVSAVVGYDRDFAEKSWDTEGLRAMIREHRRWVVGVGESGLDYHYEPQSASLQKKLFSDMLEVAAESVLPIVVHSREADADTLDLLRAFVRNWKGDPARPGVLHCFTGSYEFACKLLDLGLMISFSGILTFRNADDLRDCARRLPIDRLLIETDAPYLAPVPFRGKTNEPAMVPKVAETLASIRSDTLQTLASRTTGNARFLFQAAKEEAT